MVYENLANRNVSEGFHVIFIYLNDITNGLFINTFLVVIWLIVMLGVFKHQKAEIYNGDMPSACAVASFVVTIVTILLRLIPSLISNMTLGVVIAIMIISLLWLFYSRDD